MFADLFSMALGYSVSRGGRGVMKLEVEEVNGSRGMWIEWVLGGNVGRESWVVGWRCDSEMFLYCHRIFQDGRN